MSQADPPRTRPPKGVTPLARARGGRAFRASVRTGKGAETHLGLYETVWLAAFAHATAARLLNREPPRLEIPPGAQPTADQVRAITAKVRARLGLDPGQAGRRAEEVPPETDDLLTLFEVTVVGFWRSEAASDAGDHPEGGLDAAAGRVFEAARLLFWSRAAGHPDPLDAMTRLLGRRLDAAFRRAEVTREVLDDDGDEPFLVARWLAHPDAAPGRRYRSFRDEVRHRYPGLFGGDPAGGFAPPWASVLGVDPPFDPDRVRAAFRARSRTAHPDAGGTDAAFVRLRDAYEQALADLDAYDD